MLFNHDIVGSYPNEQLVRIPGCERYVARSLGITKPGDIIQLHPDLRHDWEYICEHYHRVGLPHTMKVVWDLDPAVANDYPERELSPFMYVDDFYKLRPDHDWYRTMLLARSKNDFLRLAHEVGAPIPRTLMYDGTSDVCYADVHYPCFLKADVSASGMGVFRVKDEAELRKILESVEGPLQIQDEIADATFLNLQYDCTSGGAKRIIVTEQILDGFVHCGNRFPARRDPWEVTDKVANLLAKMGQRGIIGIDVAISGDDAIVIECNPRYNGASYPTIVAHKLNAKHWVSQSMKTRHRSLAHVDFAHPAWFDPVRGSGAVLLNWGPLYVGGLGLLVIGNPEEERAVLRLLTHEVL